MSRRMLFVLSGHATMGGGKPAGCYFPELVHPLYVMQERGLAVDFTTPGEQGPALTQTDFNDPVQIRLLMDRQAMDRILAAPLPQTVDAEQYDGIFFTGGHGGLYDFPDNPHLIAIAENIWARGGVVSAMCHGPAGLLNLKDASGEFLIQDQPVTCFSRAEEVTFGVLLDAPYVLEDKLQARGARYCCYGVNQGFITSGRGGRLLTGQNWYSSQLVAEAVATAVLAG
ncbi:type 1 glutamine amidotransferase domain-containing protein [Megalodesulfovibrio paquesii]